MAKSDVLTYSVLVFLIALGLLEFFYIPLFGVKPGTVAVPFWQHPPRAIIFHAFYLVSPALAKFSDFLFCWCVGLGLWFGFRQVSGKNVLDQPERGRIFSFIKNHPGIHFRRLGRETGINRGTLSYHLRKLIRAGKVLALERNGFTRYFENGGKYNALEQKIISSLNNEQDRSILFRLSSSPASHDELRAALNVAGPSVSWHMKRLCNDQLVSARKEGRQVRYALNRDVLVFLQDNGLLSPKE